MGKMKCQLKLSFWTRNCKVILKLQILKQCEKIKWTNEQKQVKRKTLPRGPSQDDVPGVLGTCALSTGDPTLPTSEDWHSPGVFSFSARFPKSVPMEAELANVCGLLLSLFSRRSVSVVPACDVLQEIKTSAARLLLYCIKSISNLFSLPL